MSEITGAIASVQLSKLPGMIEQFREYGIETFLWMVNTPYTYNIAKELGFTWVTTDFYDAIVK